MAKKKTGEMTALPSPGTRTVEVMALGQESKKIEVNGSESFNDVLSRAGIRSENIMADGLRVNPSDSVSNAKVINAIPQVKGGLQ